MTDPKEIGDVHAMAAMVDVVIGRYEEAEAYATACIEQARGFDAGSYLHGLAWRVVSRLSLGDWSGLLADQAELERLAEQDPRDLPAGYLMGAYGCAALCHVLRGDTVRADHYIDVGIQSFERRRAARPDVLEHTPALAVAMARRGRVAEALPLIPLIPHSSTASRFLEARCEIATLEGDMGQAAELVAAARAEAEFGGQLGPAALRRPPGGAGGRDGGPARPSGPALDPVRCGIRSARGGLAGGLVAAAPRRDGDP